MNDSKVLLTYEDQEGNYKIESVWAKRAGDYYIINNIPFFASNIALGDIVSVTKDDGALYFEELINPSGDSTVQIIFLNVNDKKIVEKKLENFGCTWEGSHLKNLIAVDIPKEVSYPIVKEYLDKGEKENKWSYREACLSDVHRELLR
jgi:hypothetical protein